MTARSRFSHAGVGQAAVFPHHRGQRETQPRVVGEVVVAQRERVAAALRLEAEAQMAAHAGGVTEADLELVALVQRPHAREQLVVAPLVGLEMRGADQHQRRGIGGKLLAAAIGTLQLGKQRIDAREIFIGVALVPDAHGEECEHVHEVIVEENRQLDAAGRLGAALLGEKLQHVDRDDVGIGLLPNAVPVVQDVKPFGASAAIVGADRAVEKDLVAAGAKLVGTHRVAEQREGGAKRFRRGALVDDVLPRRSPQGALEDGAGLLERDVH